jgi:hypothetical protein
MYIHQITWPTFCWLYIYIILDYDIVEMVNAAPAGSGCNLVVAAPVQGLTMTKHWEPLWDPQGGS